MHVNMSQGPLYTEFCGKNARPWSSTGLYTCRKNPSVWTQCLGRKGGFKNTKNIYNHEKINVPIWLAQRPSSGKRKSSVATPTSEVSGMDGAPQMPALATKVSHGSLTVSPVGPWPAVLNPANASPCVVASFSYPGARVCHRPPRNPSGGWSFHVFQGPEYRKKRP